LFIHIFRCHLFYTNVIRQASFVIRQNLLSFYGLIHNYGGQNEGDI